MTNNTQSQPAFSHVSYATDYMHIAVNRVVNHFHEGLMGKRVLDMPAGNGWVGEVLSNRGAVVTSADINHEKPHYSQIDMEFPLPFEDEAFDAIVCCEGIEHVFSPFRLFSELARVLAPGGILVLTTPNVQNLYSRWQFLCTGYLFQFDPYNKIPLKEGQVADKGHISPVFYGQLRYWSEHLGLSVKDPTGGRMKRVLLFPLLAPVLLVGLWWNYRDWKRTSNDPARKVITKHLFKVRVLMSRSLIFEACKPVSSQDQ